MRSWGGSLSDEVAVLKNTDSSVCMHNEKWLMWTCSQLIISRVKSGLDHMWSETARMPPFHCVKTLYIHTIIKITFLQSSTPLHVVFCATSFCFLLESHIDQESMETLEASGCENPVRQKMPVGYSALLLVQSLKIPGRIITFPH